MTMISLILIDEEMTSNLKHFWSWPIHRRPVEMRILKNLSKVIVIINDHKDYKQNNQFDYHHQYKHQYVEPDDHTTYKYQYLHQTLQDLATSKPASNLHCIIGCPKIKKINCPA